MFVCLQGCAHGGVSPYLAKLALSEAECSDCAIHGAGKQGIAVRCPGEVHHTALKEFCTNANWASLMQDPNCQFCILAANGNTRGHFLSILVKQLGIEAGHNDGM